MKATLVVGAFLAAGLIASPVFAKVGQPIQGTDVGLDHEPGNVVISQTKTNDAGVAVFQNVKPGKYQLTINQVTRTGTTPAGVCPCVIEITVPGQAKVVQIISNAVRGSRVKGAISGTVVDPQSLSPVAFTVRVHLEAGGANPSRTVTVTITKVGAGQLQLPRT